jgi:hypothetical protein
MDKSKMKYVPLIGMFYKGIPFVKNPTEPTDFKSTLKYHTQRFWKTMYHIILIVVLNFLLIIIFFLLTH